MTLFNTTFDGLSGLRDTVAVPIASIAVPNITLTASSPQVLIAKGLFNTSDFTVSVDGKDISANTTRAVLFTQPDGTYYLSLFSTSGVQLYFRWNGASWDNGLVTNPVGSSIGAEFFDLPVTPAIVFAPFINVPVGAGVTMSPLLAAQVPDVMTVAPTVTTPSAAPMTTAVMPVMADTTLPATVTPAPSAPASSGLSPLAILAGLSGLYLIAKNKLKG